MFKQWIVRLQIRIGYLLVLVKRFFIPEQTRSSKPVDESLAVKMMQHDHRQQLMRQKFDRSSAPIGIEGSAVLDWTYAEGHRGIAVGSNGLVAIRLIGSIHWNVRKGPTLNHLVGISYDEETQVYTIEDHLKNLYITKDFRSWESAGDRRSPLKRVVNHD